MAIDRQGTGLAIVRICLGVFLIFEGLMKYTWFANPSILAGILNGWSQAAAPGSIARSYLDHVVLPGLAIFARLVPLGEFCAGVALLVGLWTPFVAFVVFAMVLNFHVAGGTLFRFAFLTNPYGLPVLGSALGLTLGGVRLPWSLRG
jgi:uncharacterized membrane protein YphA (DoxX/SURF4 family)